MLIDYVYITRPSKLIQGEVIDSIQCYISTRETMLYKNNPDNIANIYIKIFCNSLLYWDLMYRWKK